MSVDSGDQEIKIEHLYPILKDIEECAITKEEIKDLKELNEHEYVSVLLNTFKENKLPPYNVMLWSNADICIEESDQHNQQNDLYMARRYFIESINLKHSNDEKKKIAGNTWYDYLYKIHPEILMGNHLYTIAINSNNIVALNHIEKILSKPKVYDFDKLSEDMMIKIIEMRVISEEEMEKILEKIHKNIIHKMSKYNVYIIDKEKPLSLPYYACYKGYIKLYQYLISYDENMLENNPSYCIKYEFDDYYSLSWICIGGHIDMFKLYYKKYICNLYQCNLIIPICFGGNMEIFKIFLNLDKSTFTYSICRILNNFPNMFLYILLNIDIMIKKNEISYLDANFNNFVKNTPDIALDICREFNKLNEDRKRIWLHNIPALKFYTKAYDIEELLKIAQEIKNNKR